MLLKLLLSLLAFALIKAGADYYLNRKYGDLKRRGKEVIHIDDLNCSADTVPLLLTLYQMEYALLAERSQGACHNDTKAQLPEAVVNEKLNAEWHAAYIMVTTNYIRTQRGAPRLRPERDLDFRLRLAIRQLEEAADRI
jgi:hypothetical protein